MKSDFSAAFVGTCQVTGMAHTARLLFPKARIEPYHIGVTLSAGEIAEKVAGYDLVVTQFTDFDPNMTAISPAALASRVDQVVYMPVFGFTGLQPDSTYIINSDGVLPGAIGDSHSLITVGGYLLGLPQKRVERLFNAHVFSELGYFDAFEASVSIMTDTFARAGYDMTGKPEHWLETTGSFMYTINHPSISVLKEMTMAAFIRAGLLPSDAKAPANVYDDLARSAIVPVFPALAKRIGAEGSDVFLKSLTHEDESRELPLHDFIALSYEIYDQTTPDKLIFGRVEDVRAKLESLLF